MSTIDKLMGMEPEIEVTSPRPPMYWFKFRDGSVLKVDSPSVKLQEAVTHRGRPTHITMNHIPEEKAESHIELAISILCPHHGKKVTLNKVVIVDV